MQLRTNRFNPEENMLNNSIDAANVVYECANPANRTTVVTTAYGAGFNLAAGNICLISYVSDDPAANTQVYTVAAITAVAVANGVWTITFPDNTLAAGTLTACDIMRLPDTANIHQACNNVVNPAGARRAYYEVTTTSNALNIQTYRDLIGKFVRVTATNMVDSGGAALPYYDTVLADVQRVNRYVVGGETDELVLRFQAPFYIADNTTMSAIVVYIASKNPAIVFDHKATGTDYNSYTCPTMSIDRIPLWVGQKVTFTAYNITASANIAVECLISALVANGDGTDVTFDRNVALAAQDATNPSLFANLSATKTLTYSEPNLVLEQLSPDHRLVKKLGIPQQIGYANFTLDRVNVSQGTINFTKLFDIEANVKNLFALVIDPDFTHNNDFLSNTQITSYRWKINNVDKTTRDIVMNSSLELDTIIQTLESSSLQLQSLRKNYSDTNIYMPMTSVPLGVPKQVELSIVFSAGLAQDMILYLVKESIASL
jgi:hypothetical protein